MNRLEDRPELAAPMDPVEFGRALGAPGDACDREVRLYARYVRVLALLCECAPYVDEPDHSDLIDQVLSDVSSNYPLDWRRLDCSVEISPRRHEAEAA